MRALLQEFRDFALRGNVVDMAVGIIIGAAFGTITKSLVSDIMMPPLGLLVGGVEFGDLFIVLKQGAEQGPYATLADAQAAGAVTINYGLFINNVVSFLLVALAVFVVVRVMNRVHRKKEEAPPAAPATKECGFCFSTIPQRASRCPHCTSNLT